MRGLNGLESSDKLRSPHSLSLSGNSAFSKPEASTESKVQEVASRAIEAQVEVNDSPAASLADRLEDLSLDTGASHHPKEASMDEGIGSSPHGIRSDTPVSSLVGKMPPNTFAPLAMEDALEPEEAMDLPSFFSHSRGIAESIQSSIYGYNHALTAFFFSMLVSSRVFEDEIQSTREDVRSNGGVNVLKQKYLGPLVRSFKDKRFLDFYLRDSGERGISHLSTMLCDDARRSAWIYNTTLDRTTKSIRFCPKSQLLRFDCLNTTQVRENPALDPYTMHETLSNFMSKFDPEEDVFSMIELPEGRSIRTASCDFKSRFFPRVQEGKELPKVVFFVRPKGWVAKDTSAVFPSESIKINKSRYQLKTFSLVERVLEYPRYGLIPSYKSYMLEEDGRIFAHYTAFVAQHLRPCKEHDLKAPELFVCESEFKEKGPNITAFGNADLSAFIYDMCVFGEIFVYERLPSSS